MRTGSIIGPTFIMLAISLLVSGGPEPHAQSPDVSRVPETGQVLHRRLPPIHSQGGSAAVFYYDPRQGGTLPTELEQNGRRINAPATDPLPRPDELVYGRTGLSHAASGESLKRFTATAEGDNRVVDPRSTHASQANPDRDTETEGTLNYHTVFDPTVLPFKRNRALNHITEDRVLRLARGQVTSLQPIGNRTQPGWEVFWGTLLIEANAGDDVPLPSIAPESRILSYETIPLTEVTFFEDEADNIYVRPATDGRFRLVFVMDAPTEYFGRALPSGLRLSDVPDALRPRVPRHHRRTVRRTIRATGIDLDLPYSQLVAKLVAYFGSFEAGALPTASDDIYRDLVLAKKGICRHRTYGFVATALGLGIPARYVLNEAHVFAEVWMPGTHSNWLRIDLGGEAERLVVHGGQGRALHEPNASSPLSGEPGSHAAGAREVHGLPRPSADQPRSKPETPTPGVEVPATLDHRIPRPVARPGQTPSRTTLSLDASMLYRGDTVSIEGQVTDLSGATMPAGQVQILLTTPTTGEVVRLLDLLDLKREGRFQGQVTLPANLKAGRYELVAEYLGDGMLAPSTSE